MNDDDLALRNLTYARPQPGDTRPARAHRGLLAPSRVLTADGPGALPLPGVPPADL